MFQNKTRWIMWPATAQEMILYGSRVTTRAALLGRVAPLFLVGQDVARL
jgi:hypothetical protein